MWTVSLSSTSTHQHADNGTRPSVILSWRCSCDTSLIGLNESVFCIFSAAVNFWYDMEYDIKYNYFQLMETLCEVTGGTWHHISCVMSHWWQHWFSVNMKRSEIMKMSWLWWSSWSMIKITTWIHMIGYVTLSWRYTLCIGPASHSGHERRLIKVSAAAANHDNATFIKHFSSQCY